MAETTTIGSYESSGSSFVEKVFGSGRVYGQIRRRGLVAVLYVSCLHTHKEYAVAPMKPAGNFGFIGTVARAASRDVEASDGDDSIKRIKVDDDVWCAQYVMISRRFVLISCKRKPKSSKKKKAFNAFNFKRRDVKMKLIELQISVTREKIIHFKIKPESIFGLLGLRVHLSLLFVFVFVFVFFNLF